MTEPPNAGHPAEENRGARRMTVAHVRLRADYAEVMFVESARIYLLARAHTAFAATLAALQTAATAGRPVRVRFSPSDGELIEEVLVNPAR